MAHFFEQMNVSDLAHENVNLPISAKHTQLKLDFFHVVAHCGSAGTRVNRPRLNGCLFSSLHFGNAYDSAHSKRLMAYSRLS